MRQFCYRLRILRPSRFARFAIWASVIFGAIYALVANLVLREFLSTIPLLRSRYYGDRFLRPRPRPRSFASRARLSMWTRGWLPSGREADAGERHRRDHPLRAPEPDQAGSRRDCGPGSGTPRSAIRVRANCELPGSSGCQLPHKGKGSIENLSTSMAELSTTTPSTRMRDDAALAHVVGPTSTGNVSAMMTVSTHKAGAAPSIWSLRAETRAASAALRVIHHGFVRVSSQE